MVYRSGEDGTFTVTRLFWDRDREWKYNLRRDDEQFSTRSAVESVLRLAPSEDEENSKKRKLNSKEGQQAKKKYLADPLTRKSKCTICLDPLLGPYNKLDDGKVINLGLDRNVVDDNTGNVIGKENSDEVVIMYCCGNGFHKRCIDYWFSEGRSLRKCPGCNRDLKEEINEGRPVYRNAEVVKKGKETIEVETVTEIKLCAFKKLKF